MLSEWFYKKLDQIFGYLVLIVLFGLLIFEANIEIKDLDLWLHIGVGRYILDNFQIPAFDVLSATISGAPWINHEWLFQIIVAKLYQAFGVDGIINLQVGLVLFSFAMLYAWGRQTGKRTVVLLLLLIVMLNYRLRFTHRPDLFSLFFLILYIQALSFGLRSKISIIYIFIIQAIWTNIHGFFILGPLILLLSNVTHWIKGTIRLPFEWGNVGKLERDEANCLKAMLVVSVFACFVNPYFAKGVWYPLKVLFSVNADSKIFFDYIGELAKPMEYGNIFNLSRYPFYKLLIFISGLSFVLNYRKLDIGALVLWVLFLFLSLKAVRNISYFAIISYFCFLSNYRYFSSSMFFSESLLKIKFDWMVSILVKALMCLWMISYFSRLSLGGYFDFDRYERKSEYGGISQKNFPIKAVDFLVDSEIEGRFFNDFNSGAYLVGRVFPKIKIYIDGRTEVYGPEFFKQYQKIWFGDYMEFKKVADQYNLTGAFINSITVPAPAEIIKSLKDDAQWKLVYFDYDAAIFLRDIPQNQEWIKRYNVDLGNYVTPKIDLKRLGARQATPYEHIRRAYGLFNMGYVHQAEAEAEEVLRIEPNFAKAFVLLGKVDMENKQYEKAYENFRKAKVIDVNDMEARFNLGKSLMRLNQLKEAEKHALKAVAGNPKNAKALYLLTLIYAKQGRYKQAIEQIKKVNQLDVKGDEMVDEIVNEFKQNGKEKLINQIIY